VSAGRKTAELRICAGELLAKTPIAAKNQAGWAAVRKKLDAFDRAGLLVLVHDLYDASALNRRFLEARLLSSPAFLEEYRRLVADAVYPDPFSRRPVSVRDATATITEYRRSTGDLTGTVDLMLTFLEAGTEQAADLGYGDDPYFAALERKLDAIAKSWSDLSADARKDKAKRLDWVRTRAQSIGWGYGDYVADVVTALQRSHGNTKT
jgi:hypothetical protein